MSEQNILSQAYDIQEEALQIYLNEELDRDERRDELNALIKKHNRSKMYQDAVKNFIINTRQTDSQDDVEEIVNDIVQNPVFALVQVTILAMLLDLLFGRGPKLYLVPQMYLPVNRPSIENAP